MSLKVNEIFHSIQGESTHAGRPCVFIRLTGCNLRCAYCDTRYAYDEGEQMEISRVLERVSAFGCGLIEVTGGEPLIQEETPGLVSALLSEGYTVLLETNGSLDIDRVDAGCARIVDVKCPSSGMAERNDPLNLERLTEGDELKFVIGSREDYEFAEKVLLSSAGVLAAARCAINFSPVFGAISPRTLAEWIIEDRLPVRLNIQLHKIIWEPDARSV
ncbi:MAG: radical SAM protein [Syntrophobacteraceae bacterium]